jgi:phenylpropionate dioxygenase-like ring-hydroxylating dioxygenase large terminal subunit
MTAVDKKALIEKRVNEGPPWPVVPGGEVRRDQVHAPYGTRLLGEKIVLWRDIRKRSNASRISAPIAARRSAMAKIHDGNIGCRYHGVIVDGDGVVQRVPAMPECALEGRKALKSFP